ncbi:MAG: TolC family protein [Eudoraea sp.]|nr:TolC family protein [Eudoraea sp.]
MKYSLTFMVSILLSVVVQAQSLQQYIEEATANNPGLLAFEKRYEIAQEKVRESNWLPNTELGLGYFISEPETRTGAQVARFTTRQMLPWFGTISARKNAAGAIAETEYLNYVIAKRKIKLKVSQSYYKLFGLEARKDVLDENIALLRTYEELALNAVEVSKASAVDVLRLQMRQNDLEHLMEVLNESIKAERSRFNSLLDRDIGVEVLVMKGLTIPDEELVVADSLYLNPELHQYDLLYESISQLEEVNQKERSPMLGFGLDYVPVQERPELDFSDNGKDIIMPMVSLSIPIFSDRYDSRSKQNELRQQELIFQKQERFNDLETALAEAIFAKNESRIAHAAQVKNLEQAKNAEQILIKTYETGTIDFNDILDIQELQLKFQLNKIEAVQQFYVQSMIINYLTN